MIFHRVALAVGAGICGVLLLACDADDEDFGKAERPIPEEANVLLDRLASADSYHLVVTTIPEREPWTVDVVHDKGIRILREPEGDPCPFDIPEDPQLAGETCADIEIAWVPGRVLSRACGKVNHECVEWIESSADPPIMVPPVGPSFTAFVDFPLVAIEYATYEQPPDDGTLTGSIDGREILSEAYARLLKGNLGGSAGRECEVDGDTVTCGGIAGIRCRLTWS